MSISNYDDVIDTRDIIERIEELENDLETAWNEIDHTQYLISKEELCERDFEELEALKSIAEEAEKYCDDWQYGAQLIRESYFEIYMDEMIADCYELPEDLPFWMTVVYDYEALKQDYTEIDFDGVTYYIR